MSRRVTLSGFRPFRTKNKASWLSENTAKQRLHVGELEGSQAVFKGLVLEEVQVLEVQEVVVQLSVLVSSRVALRSVGGRWH